MPVETFALLDALGFREAIKDQSLEQVEGQMFRFFYTLRAASLDEAVVAQMEEPPSYEQVVAVEQGKACKFHQFSDTLLLRAKSESEQHVEDLVNVVRKLVAISCIHKPILRGALVHGELAVHEDLDLYLGKGMIHAYDLEHAQEWAGCVLHDSFSHRWPQVVDRFRQANTLVEYPAPMKDGPVRDWTCVNWPTKIVGNLEDFLIGPGGLPPANVTWDVWRKLQNTLAFYQQFRPAPSPRPRA